MHVYAIPNLYMLNEGSSIVLAVVRVTSNREAACRSTQSPTNTSAEQYSTAQIFKMFKHTRNPIQFTKGEHMCESCAGRRMPPCPTVYALATLVFLHVCLLCHLTTILSNFFKTVFVQTISVTISQSHF